MRVTMLARTGLSLIAGAVLSVAAAAVFASAAAASGRLGEDINIPLVTQDGVKVHFYDDLLKGKIVAVNFIYTSCLFTCPLETARLAQVQRILGDRLGKDIFFYSISIDPEHDTPEVLKEYAKEFDAGPGWTFLTGRASDIDMLAYRLGLTDDENITEGPGKDIDGHTPHILIGNEKTQQWIRNSSTDNPTVLAHLLVSFVGGDEDPQFAGRSAASGGAPIRFTVGEYLFARECAACHTIGQGDRLGPDLKYVSRAHDRDWLRRYIQEPNKMREAGDVEARSLAAKYKMTMPNLGVGDRDVEALLDYLAAQSASQ